METITWKDFEKIDMRTGTVLTAVIADGAKIPAYRLTIDFGNEIGILKTSAQLTKRYTAEQLPGKKVIAVVNFPPKQIGKFMSECLVLGVVDGTGDVALLSAEGNVENGLRIA